MAAIRGGYYVEGLRETVRDLERFGAEVSDLKDVMGSIADLAATSAAAHAPMRSGRLRASIRGNRAKARAVVAAGRSAVPYAGAINYGWPKRSIAPAGFMQAADQEVSPQAVRLLEDGITRLIRSKGLT